MVPGSGSWVLEVGPLRLLGRLVAWFGRLLDFRYEAEMEDKMLGWILWTPALNFSIVPSFGGSFACANKSLFS